MKPDLSTNNGEPVSLLDDDTRALKVGFVDVPPEALRSMLRTAGFHQRKGPGEEVWERWHHKCRRHFVRVYTSIHNGQMAGPGADAIRVVALYLETNGQLRGVAKTKRVHRTGTVKAVLQRTLARMREAYAVINRRTREQQEG